jgi:hypothetical protein
LSKLIYGFVKDEHRELFNLLEERFRIGLEDADEELGDLCQELQREHGVELLYCVDRINIDVLIAHEISLPSDCNKICGKTLEKEVEYKERLCNFLQAAGITRTDFVPSWYILEY